MKKPEIVAEFTINHLGMVNIVLATLERCKAIGIDYAKFKIKNVEKYYEKDGKIFNGYDFIKYRSSLELSYDDFRVINEWCYENGMKWYATCHDEEGVKFLSQFEPPYYKIASMDALNDKLFDSVLENNTTNVPLIISIGGLDDSRTERIVSRVLDNDFDLILLHTVSIYPTPINRCNIGAISRLKKNFGSERVRIGYSGHEVGYVPTLLAVQAGADMIERHITLSKNMNLHHLQAALTMYEFDRMVDEVNQVVDTINVSDREFFEEEHQFLKDRQYD